MPQVPPLDYTTRYKILAGRTQYANYVVQNELVNQGRKIKYSLLFPDREYNSIISLQTGIENTTTEEFSRYVSSVAIPPSTTIPSAPSNLSATAGNNQLTISFTLDSNGGTPITNYEFSIDDGVTFTAFSPAQTSSPVIISGLTNGTSYDIQLKAVNGNGVGPASSTITATPSTTPSAPSSLSTTPGDGQLSISFTQSSTGGSPITNYQYSINGGTSFTAFSPAQTSSPVVITGLTNGVSYNVRLIAVNSIGNSSASSTTTGTPAGDLPGAPTGLSAVAGNLGAYILFTPGSSGSSAISNYEYSIDGGSTFTAFSPAQTFSPVYISGLTNSTLYSVQLKAVNSSGAGTASATTTVTPGVTALRTSNLIIELDAGNAASYSGSGTTWTNLRSSGSYSASLVNGPTYSATSGGMLTFNGTNSYANIPDNAAIRATVGGAITAMIWAKVNSAGFTSGDGLISKQFGSSSDYDGYSLSLNTSGGLSLNMNGAAVNGNYGSTSNVFSTDTWALFSIVVRFGGGAGAPSQAYVSARQVVSRANSEIAIPSPTASIQLPRGIQDPGNFAPADVGAFYYYNTALTQTEIIQNFDATRSRYGV